MMVDIPHFECAEDALKAAVQALGGSKIVGQMIWPDKTVDNASRLLMDVLNPNRAEKLDMSQIMFIFKKAKEVGCYSPFVWFSLECGFEAAPISKEVMKDRLVDVIEGASKTLAQALTQLSKIQGM